MNGSSHARVGGVLAVMTALASFGWLAGTADAASPGRTHYTYYTIVGNSARALYDQMYALGPHVSGARAFAATTMKPQLNGELVTSGGRCRVSGLKIGVDFTINLPRLAAGASLSAADRKRWDHFQGFVRKHEEKHRAIWLGCVRTAERRIAKLRESNCDAIDKAAAKIFDEVSAECDRKHDAFDAAERSRLMRHPLILAAQKVRGTTSTKALASVERQPSGTQKRSIRGVRE